METSCEFDSRPWYHMPLKNKEQHRIYMRRRYNEDPAFRAKHQARVAQTRKTYLAAFNAIIIEFRKNGCLLCPERESCVLVAHHVDPAKKDFELGYARAQKLNLKRVADELTKCVCLCMNCHAKFHAGILTLGL